MPCASSPPPIPTGMFHADLGALPAGDVLVQAGDTCRGGDEEDLAQVAGWLRTQPHAHKIVVPGNHDFLFQIDEARARCVMGSPC